MTAPQLALFGDADSAPTAPMEVPGGSRPETIADLRGWIEATSRMPIAPPAAESDGIDRLWLEAAAQSDPDVAYVDDAGRAVIVHVDGHDAALAAAQDVYDRGRVAYAHWKSTGELYATYALLRFCAAEGLAGPDIPPARRLAPGSRWPHARWCARECQPGTTAVDDGGVTHTLTDDRQWRPPADPDRHITIVTVPEGEPS